MLNVYIDPLSPEHLSDKLLVRDEANDSDDRLFVWRYLKDYCLEKNIRLHTIDLRTQKNATPQDVYVSLDHKGFLKKLYWKKRNKIKTR